jgi:hypothetical protein
MTRLLLTGIQKFKRSSSLLLINFLVVNEIVQSIFHASSPFGNSFEILHENF